MGLLEERGLKYGYINFNWGEGVVDFLKSTTGDYIFPITKIESIYDNSGNTLQSILDNKQPIGNYSVDGHTHDYLPLTGGEVSGPLYKTNPPSIAAMVLKSANNNSGGVPGAIKILLPIASNSCNMMFFGYRHI